MPKERPQVLLTPTRISRLGCRHTNRLWLQIRRMRWRVPRLRYVSWSHFVNADISKQYFRRKVSPAFSLIQTRAHKLGKQWKHPPHRSLLSPSPTKQRKPLVPPQSFQRLRNQLPLRPPPSQSLTRLSQPAHVLWRCSLPSPSTSRCHSLTASC